jgi:hypothetical protein
MERVALGIPGEKLFVSSADISTICCRGLRDTRVAVALCDEQKI